jgi:hypothetical protein
VILVHTTLLVARMDELLGRSTSDDGTDHVIYLPNIVVCEFTPPDA